MRVVIIGAGFGGIAAAVALARNGISDVTVFEKAPEFGGTWFYNSYPGAACDVPSHLYSFLLRAARDWSRLCSPRSALFMRWQVRDRDLRRRVWPDYTFGCKRVLFGSFFLPTLARPDVELVTDAISHMASAGIVTVDGRLHEVDCVIWGTGFKATEFMFPMEIIGAAGRDLREVWAGGAHAHLGMTVPGFPSMFIMYGPNTNTSGGSIIFYHEAQASYVRQALQWVERHGGGAIEVRPEIEAASDRELQARFAGTAWTRCDSWYRDDTGRIVANWPGYMREYMERTRRFEPAEYRFVEQPARVAA